MAKPTDLARWGTAASAVIVPSEAQKTSGWLTGDRPPAKIFNYLANRAYGWFQYLNNLHLEPDFLNKNYRWVGHHDFAGTGHITTDQEIRLRGNAEVVYYDPTGAFPQRKPLWVLISPLHGMAQLEGSSAWFHDNDADGTDEIYTITPGTTRAYPITIPTGARLMGVEVAYNQHGSTTDGATFSVIRSTKSLSSPYTPGRVVMHSQTVSGAAGAKLYSCSGLNHVCNRQSETITLLVRVGAPESVETIINWIRVWFDDYGPRNY